MSSDDIVRVMTYEREGKKTAAGCVEMKKNRGRYALEKSHTDFLI